AALLDLVRGEVAAVLGYRTQDAIDAERPLKDFGIDSLTAIEVRERLAAATGLRLPAGLLFDYPTVEAISRRLVELLVGFGPERIASAATTGIATDDPIAIVGMTCRLPGGVRGPQELWEMVAAGIDGITPFPTDRGWDPAGAGVSYTREGGFVYDAT